MNGKPKILFLYYRRKWILCGSTTSRRRQLKGLCVCYDYSLCICVCVNIPLSVTSCPIRKVAKTTRPSFSWFFMSKPKKWTRKWTASKARYLDKWPFMVRRLASSTVWTSVINQIRWSSGWSSSEIVHRKKTRPAIAVTDHRNSPFSYRTKFQLSRSQRSKREKEFTFL